MVPPLIIFKYSYRNTHLRAVTVIHALSQRQAVEAIVERDQVVNEFDVQTHRSTLKHGRVVVRIRGGRVRVHA